MEHINILSSRIAFLGFFLSLFVFKYADGSTVSSGGRRMWEIAVDTKETTDTVESKVCELEIAADQDFLATFTVIDAINRKVATADSKVDIIDSILDQLDLSQLQTILSKVDVVDQESMSLCDAITIVSVDDFGGTWTALDALGDNLCEKFNTVFDAVSTLESSIDQLIADNAAQFTATVTKLEVLQINVVDSMIKVQNLADQLDSDLNELDSLIDIVKNNFSTIESKVDVLELSIEQSFAGTFTAIEALFAKVCEVDNKVDQLDVAIETACVNTFSSLEAVEEKICLADSKVDTLNDLLEILKGKASIIDEPLIVDCSLVDALLMDLQTVNSSLDIVATKVAGITSRVDLVDMLAATALDKLCTSESIVDQVEVADSLIDTINNTFVTIESKIENIGILYTNSVESKLCVAQLSVESTYNDLSVINSNLELIDNAIQDTDSVVDEVDTVIALLESKICIVDEKADMVDNSLEVICSQIEVIDTAIDETSGTIRSAFDAIQLLESGIDSAVSNVDLLAATINSTESKLCLIDNTFAVVDSNIDVTMASITTAHNEVSGSFVSFDMTWTMLPFFQDKLCTVSSKLDVISSLIDDTQLEINLDTTFTAIEEVHDKACIVQDSSLLQINPACIVQEGLAGTFTVQDEILDKLCEASSYLDEASLSTTLLDPIQDCLGTPIRQEDVGTVGFIISTPGRYYLAENIVFSPPVFGGNAITISADNVYLDLNGKAMEQGNSSNGTFGIVTSGTRNNISIVNGTLNKFRAEGISNISSGTPITNLLLKNLLIQNSGVGTGGPIASRDGIRLLSCSNIAIHRCTVTDAGGEGASFFACNYIYIENSSFIGSILGTGLQLESCAQLFIDNCICSSNLLNGLEFENTANDMIIQNSSLIGNGQDGIGELISSGVNNLVIRSNTIQSNGRYGVNLSGSGTIVRNCIISNDISSNITSGIIFDSTASNNAILFNRFVQNGTNIDMGASDAANTVLGNFAYNSGGDAQNYNLSATTVNRVIISQSGAFPTTIPTYWHNISMIP